MKRRGFLKILGGLPFVGLAGAETIRTKNLTGMCWKDVREIRAKITASRSGWMSLEEWARDELPLKLRARAATGA